MVYNPKIDPVVFLLSTSNRPLSLSDIILELAKMGFNSNCKDKDTFRRMTMNKIIKLLNDKVILIDSIRRPKRRGRPHRLYRLTPENREKNESDIL